MIRAWLTVLCLLCAVDASAQLRLGGSLLAGGDAQEVAVVPPSLSITQPDSEPYHTSVTAQVLAGSAAAGTAALSTLTYTCSGATTIGSTAITVAASWSTSPTLNVGTTVCVVTLTDASARTAQATQTFIVSNPDAGAPTVTAPADVSIEASSTSFTGTCTDDVACVSVTWSRTGASGACTLIGSGTSLSYSCTPSLTTTGGFTTANTITVTALDQASNNDTDVIVITRTVTLAVTTTSLGTCTQGVACTKTLSATGGLSGSYVWDNNGAGTTLNDADAQCAGSAMPASGTGSFGTFTTLGVCSFTAKVTRGAATDTQALTITVVEPGSESAHTYFTTMATSPPTGTAHQAWSLRTQNGNAGIGGAEGINDRKNLSGESTYFHYKYPGASSGDCYLSSCNDTSADPQDAAKAEIPTKACVPQVADRAITSTSAENPSTLTLGTTGGLDANTAYAITISGHVATGGGSSPLNGVSTTLTLGENKAIGTIPLLGGGVDGIATVSICDCVSPGQTVCSGSDSIEGNQQLWFPMAISQTSGDTVLVTWDAYFETSWREQSDLTKMWGLTQTPNTTTKGSLLNNHNQHDEHNDRIEGNGAGSSSVGSLGMGFAATKILAPGISNNDPVTPRGTGTIEDSRRTPNSTNFHVQTLTWTRYWIYLRTNVPYSSSVFDTWRTVTGTASTFALTSCSTASPSVCTVAANWSGQNSQGTYRADQGATIRVTITGASDPAFNAVHTATILADGGLTFSIPRPAGNTGAAVTGASFSPHFLAMYEWVADENREATRSLFAMPWESKTAFLGAFTFDFNTSSKAGTRTADMVAYVRNVVMVKNPTLNLSGTCNETTDRGYCTVDATNNPDVLVKPLR